MSLFLEKSNIIINYSQVISSSTSLLALQKYISANTTTERHLRLRSENTARLTPRLKDVSAYIPTIQLGLHLD